MLFILVLLLMMMMILSNPELRKVNHLKVMRERIPNFFL